MSWAAGSSSTWARLRTNPVIRLVLGTLFMLAAVIVAQIVAFVLPGRAAFLSDLSAAVIVVAIITLAYIAFVRLVEKRPVMELSLTGAATEIGAGLLLGAVLIGITVGVMGMLGYYRVEGIHSALLLVLALPVMISSAYIEEILFRGTLLRLLEEWLGTWIALSLSALLFGAVHLMNPHATLWSAIAIAIEAGLLLGGAFILTRRLWLAIGIHFAWNYVQGSVLGVAVSGNQFGGLLDVSLSGPTLISGGSFGAEASIIAVAVCSLASAVLIRKAYQKGHIEPIARKEMPTISPPGGN